MTDSLAPPRPRTEPEGHDGGPPERRPQAAGHALIAGLVGLLLASLLNAESLADVAERQEEGAVRTVAMALTRPLERVSSALWLTKPRELLDALIGRDGDDVDAVRAPATPAPSPEGAEDASAEVGAMPDLDIPPTPADPAEAWIIGDSFVELFGPKLSDQFVSSEVVTPEVDFRFISGLTRPDYFDWPAHIRERLQTNPPDIVVVMFGGNDGQPVTVDGVFYERYTPDWWDLYERRVDEAMDALEGDLLAYWVGLPVMKDPRFTEHARQFNEVYREAAAERPWMRYVSSWEVFTDENGNYSDYLPNPSGEMRLMRYEDGAHFTPPGALRLARHVFGIIAEEWQIPTDEAP